MLISYAMPSASSIGNAGNVWLTSDLGGALCDGKPARRARLVWNAGETVADYVAIPITFSSPSLLRVFALLGTSLPPGVRIAFVTPSGASYGGTTGEAMTTYQPDQTTAAWAIGDVDAIADTGCTIRIYNDCNGTPWAAYGATFDLGEVWMGPAVEIGIRDGWEVQTVDPSEVMRTRNGQANVAKQSAYRVISVNFAGLSAAAARGEGLANGMDLDRVTSAMRGAARCAVIPHYRSLTTRELDAQAAARSAIFGFASQLPNVANISRGWFSGQLVVEEIPAR